MSLAQTRSAARSDKTGAAPTLTPRGLGQRAGAWLFDAESIGWLLPLIRQRAGAIVLLLLLGLIAASAALAPPYLTKLVIDEGLLAGDVRALVVWSVTLLAVGFASMGLGALNSILHMRASVGMLADLRALLTRAVLARSPLWRAQRQTGELMARIDGDAGEVQKFAFNALLAGSSSMLRLLGGAAMLFVLNWQLALIALTLAPLELAFLAWARPRTEALARTSRAERGVFAGRLAEMLNGLGQIQAARAETPVAMALASQQDRLNRALLRAQVWGEATRAVPMTLTAMVRAAIFLVGGIMVIRGEWQLGSLIAFIAYLGFLVGPLQSLLELWHAQARVRVALDRLGEVMAAEPGLAWPAHPVVVPAGRGLIELKGVEVAAGGKPILRGVEARIPPGTKVRLAGSSGVGKSSLLALLQRHADPAAGRIRLDGADVRTLSRDALRGAVALVPQRPFLMQGTVADNLRLSCPETSDSEMQSMLELVELAPRFARFGGLQAQLGEDGLTLSGGERQRLCLARTLLSRFRVLLLDEALSEVDPATVGRIVARIDAHWPQTTRILATHGAVQAHGPFDMTLDLTDWRLDS